MDVELSDYFWLEYYDERTGKAITSFDEKSMRAHHNESVDSKIFIEFIALIIRNKIYTSLKDEMLHIRKKPDYMTVPAAIKELEKIEMIRHPDGTYGLYSGATSTQKSILKAFGIDTNYLKHLVTKLSVVLRETEGGNQ